MIDFEAFERDLREYSNFANEYKNMDKSAIIKSTLKTLEHKMLLEDNFDLLCEINDELSEFDKIALLDLMEYEKELWTI